MGNRVAKVLDIDGNKLSDEVAKRKLTKEEVSSSLGYSKAFVNHLVDSNKIRPIVMNALEQMYGISYDDIKPDKLAEETVDCTVEKEQEEQLALDLNSEELWDKLSLVIYAAVRKAMTDALNA